MTKSPQMARDASKAKSATRQRKNIKRTSEPPKAVGKAYKTIGMTAEDFFKAWSRKDREALIEVLIDSLDATDGYSMSELEACEPTPLQFLDRFGDRYEDEREADDAEPDDDEIRRHGSPSAGYHEDDEPDSDDEPSVGFDDRELDEADDPRGEGVNEDGDDNPDDEPSLGWTDEEAARGRTYSGSMAEASTWKRDAMTRQQEARRLMNLASGTVRDWTVADFVLLAGRCDDAAPEIKAEVRRILRMKEPDTAA